MSLLLQDLIQQKHDDTESYERFLQKAEELAKKLVQKSGGDHPDILNGNREAIILFNNLADIEASTFQCPADDEDKAKLALQIDNVMHEKAPAYWKGDEAKESAVLNAIFPLMARDRKATIALFEIIKSQPGY
ncbi:type I site-specific deoxyribonuclease, HsdR family [Rhodopirellula europaea 6C]|uniref:Type I site-specific deoxyribonuclease, HsdR family n=1 Tax=Rhodopirellula europaea 6C TaxID=1263867 RepID=M2A432_9BACT|nr:type I site-specific deoxyribonuclease, HsdR family [Rhodopirellula europaea 6C]